MSSILKVSTLQDPTNSNTALEIDTSGRVLFPNRPALLIRKLANATYGTSPIQWDDIEFDTANAWDSTNYRYNCPVAGLYWVNVIIHNTTNQVTSGWLRKSGTNYMFGYNANLTASSGFEGNLSITALMECTTSDYIDIVGDRAAAHGIFGDYSAMQIMFMG